MPADGEVEEVDGVGDTPIDPHPRRDAAPILRLRSRDHLAGAVRLWIVVIKGRRRVFHDQRHRGVVGADDWSSPHHLPEVRDERPDELRRSHLYVQKRASCRRPAARSEKILLAVDRQVIPVFRHDDFGRDARVVSVPLDQADGPIGLDHAAFGSGWAGELGDPRPPHDDLRRQDLERFQPVEAEYFPLAVRRTRLEMGGHRQLHFVAREVGGELFVAGLLFCLLATLVALNRF